MSSSRGLEPGRRPPDWSFVPVTDLMLVVGEGLVGITTEGVFAEKPRGTERQSLKECYKKPTSEERGGSGKSLKIIKKSDETRENFAVFFAFRSRNAAIWQLRIQPQMLMQPQAVM